MEEISELGIKVLGLIIFEETLMHILEDLRKEKKHHVIDEIKYLIMKELVRPCTNIETKSRSGLMFDSDMMNEYSFIITAKGLELLEKQMKKSQKNK
jgi:hypothetical protein